MTAHEPSDIELDTPAGHMRVRLARTDDDSRLRQLFADVTMDADLALQVRREPEFAALYRMQGGTWETWVGEIDGELVGMGTIMVRTGYIAGETRRVGYLGDLRVDPKVRGREVLAALYGPVLDGFATRHGIDLYLTAIIASNDRAVRALTGPRAAEWGIPTYHLLQKFDIRALQTVAARRPSRATRQRWHVRPAQDTDVSAIAALLDADAKRRTFGEPMSAGDLQQRIARWPGLDLDDFLLLTPASEPERIMGCVAPWSASPVKQTYVTSYDRAMARVRRLQVAAATLLRAPTLPPPGGELRYAYATHLALDPSVEDTDAHRLLLHAAWHRVRRAGSGAVFLSVRAPKATEPGSARSRAYAGFVAIDLPANVYAVVPHGRGLPPGVRPGQPVGFEMALV